MDESAPARRLHRESKQLEEQAAVLRERRDMEIRRLRRDDPKRWSYGALAKAVGCSPELVAYVIKGGKAK